MKEIQKYIVIRAYGQYRKGAIIQPTGMRRDELKANGFIKKYEEPAPEPVAAPEPEPAEPEPTPEPETAVAPRVENAQRWQKRGRR